MPYLPAWLFRLLHDRRGVTALEYGFIASLLVGTIIVGFHYLGNSMSNHFSGVANCVENPTNIPNCM